MVGININCSKQDFVEEILTGIKTIETRNTNSLKPYLGKRVGIIKTGCGKAKLVGYMTIGKIVRIVDDVQMFDRYYKWHRIGPDSDRYIKDKKYLYMLYNVERCEPVEVTTKGIVAREI